MGKKAKKTKWRTLEIPSPDKNHENTHPKWEDVRRTPSANYHHYDRTTRRQSSKTICTAASTIATSSGPKCAVEEETKTLVEDEYTKITTPRQDVLFKKGYLSRRKIPETISENSVDQNSDDIAQDCMNNDEFSNYTNGDENVQPFMCPAPQSYIDPSAVYYGSGYEIYDPYMGNVTVVVGPPGGQYSSNTSCQPILTSVPCRPVPLQQVQWFNPVPSSEWCCSYSQPGNKRYSTDSQNGSGISSESSGVPESPPEMIDEQLSNNGPVFPPSYVYPGYMFGAPIYNVDGVNVQYYAPQSPVLSNPEQTASKRRKKRKRRRRTGEGEEEAESSIDDSCNRSVSSSEYISDFHPHAESNLYEDALAVQTTYAAPAVDGVCFSSLPLEVVNAPEFVPSEGSVPAASSVNDGVADSPTTVAATAAHEDIVSSGNYGQKSAGLNVYCKPFDGRGRQHDPERVSSSNNSDSGISSPGSEDASKGDFRVDEAKNERGDEPKKKPRAKRSTKAKSKDDEPKSSNRSAKKSDKAQSRKGKKDTQQLERKIAKKEFKSGRQIHNKYETVISAINNLPIREETKVERKKETRKSKKTEPEKAQKSVVNRELDICVQKIESIDVNDDDELVATVEENNNKIVDELKPSARCEGCQSKCSSGDIEDECCSRTQLAVEESHLTVVNSEPNAEMLNEYVRIEEKPMLAKLVEVGELANTEDAVELEEEISVSDFSSCRENMQPTVPPRRKKPSRRTAEETAKQLVDEVIEDAEKRILSSMACDTKLQLPITQAVTKWLNEHGGLQAVVEDPLNGSRNADDEEEDASEATAVPATASIKSKKSKPNCVIC